MKLIFIDKENITKLRQYLEDNDLENFLLLLGKMAKDYGMTRLSMECGRNRESLYKSFVKDADPKIGTIMKICNSLGFKLSIKK
jgi:probable addiction module antidote protein